MAETTYNVFKAGLPRADEDWVADDYRMLLLAGAVTIDADHATITALLAANTEASDGSYARVAGTTKSVTQDDTNDWALMDADDFDFDDLDNETPTAAVVYRHVGADGSNIPMSVHDTGFGSPSNGAGYVVATPNGVMRVQ